MLPGLSLKRGQYFLFLTLKRLKSLEQLRQPLALLDMRDRGHFGHPLPSDIGIAPAYSREFSMGMVRMPLDQRIRCGVVLELLSSSIVYQRGRREP
jgi:hypothetical protein